MRILVEKGKDRYYYSINNKEESVPLQLGKGNYDIKVLEHKTGSTYKVVYKSNINLKEFNEQEAFLTSVQPVYWKDGQVEKLAKTLLKGETTDSKKVDKVYKYIVKNIKYDHKKIDNLKDDYTPNNDNTLESKSGICYDYAALMAGMLRSAGVPTKLVKGYKNDLKTYHAWNEVLIDGKWVIIDTTYDAEFIKHNMEINMIKSASDYTKVREY